MKIVFWGTPEFAVPSLNALIEYGHKVIGVVTQPDRRRGRGNKLNYSPIKQAAIKAKIPIFTPNNINKEKDIQQQILDLDADIYIVVAYGQILPLNVIERPPYGCWNSHGSLLPRWRGAAPIQWSLLSGDKYTGIGIMQMEKGLDTGPLLMEEKIAIKDNDDFQSLSIKLSILSASLIIKAINRIKEYSDLSKDLIFNKLNLTNQRDLKGEVTYAKTIRKIDYKIDWNDNAINIQRKIKGLNPNAYCFWQEKRLKIISIDIILDKKINTNFDAINSLTYNLKPNKTGRILAITKDFSIIISTYDNPIVIRQAQLEGRKIASGKQLFQQMGAHIDQFLQ